MNRTFPLVLLLPLALAGCASSEGGVVGSGISSLSGNVVQVEVEASEQSSRGAALTTPALPVEVTLQEIGQTQTVDEEGRFEFSGDFAGEVTLSFRETGRRELLATLKVDVPDGASVVLNDIALAPSVVEVAAVTGVHFVAHIIEADCASGRLRIVDNSPRGHQLDFLLVEDTEIIDGEGQPLSCSALQPRTIIVVEEAVIRVGAQRRQGIALRIVVDGAARPTPAQIPVRLRGELVNSNCPAGLLRIGDKRVERHQPTIRITDSTILQCLEPELRPCRCGDLAFGDRLRIEGFIPARHPHVIEAERITRLERLRTVPVRAMGVVHAVNCTRALFELHDPRIARETLIVRLLPKTTLLCERRQPLPCSCSEIGVRDVAVVEGTGQYVDGRLVIDATGVLLRKTRRPDHAGPPR